MKHGRQGFTLLELLIAASITLALAGLMLAITINILGFWRRSQAAHAQAVAAKQVLDLLEQDLQTALHRRDGTCWLAADILDTPAGLANHGWLTGPGPMKPANGGSLRVLPAPDASGVPLLRDARFGLSGVWLRFVGSISETLSGNQRMTMPSVIAYQLARRPVTGNPVNGNPAPVRYSLYRVEVRAEDAFAAGYDVTAAAYASANNNPYAVNAPQSRYPRNVMNPGHANLLASNVVDFGCWLYVRDASGALQRIYPALAGDLSHHAVGGSVTSDTRFPEVADVLLRILSEEGAAQLEAIESGRVGRPPEYASDAEWWWGVVEAHSAVFIRRVEIQGGTL
jgi:type II secretory pathway pseudopilin PulG